MVRELCKEVGVSESGYYKFKKSEDSGKEKDEDLYEEIKKLKAGFKASYGYRKVGFEINEGREAKINHKKIYRVMVKYNLLSKIRRKKSSNYMNFEERFINIYENKLNRKFEQEEKNKVWLTDVTEYKSKEGVLYLSALIDCYRRRLVSYKYSTNNNVNLVLETVRAALKQKQKGKETILHSDRAFQYTGMAYTKEAQDNEIEISMSEAGEPKDNAPMESFFSSLKLECLYARKPKTLQETKDLIDEYAKFYNNQRVILKYRGSPEQIKSY